jgi:hypothetical protein
VSAAVKFRDFVSRLLSRYANIKMYKTPFLPVFSHVSEPWVDVWEQGVKENIWAQEDRSDNRMEKIT